MSTEDAGRPLTDHLGDIRSALVRVLVSFAGGLGIFFSFSDSVYRTLFSGALPVLEALHVEFVALSLLDRFWIPMKLAIAGSLALTLPVVLLEAYRFVRPALRRRELEAVRFGFLAGPVLFVGGAALWLFVVLPQAIEFLATMGPETLKNVLSLNEFVGFALSMGFVFGLLFEVPLLLLTLVHAGLVSSSTLARRRKAAALAFAVLSAVVTPSPDALSMLALLIPLLLLFELTLLLGGRVERKRVEMSHAVSK